MKRAVALLLLVSLLLSGCTALQQLEMKQYTATFLTLFDTVTSIVGKAESEQAHMEKAQAVHDELLYYHQLFDIYNDYEGINNLKTVNDSAGVAPVVVDRAMIDLLLDCRKYYELTGGRVNVAMGSVLLLWHEARNDSLNDMANAYLPDRTELEAAAEHTDIACVVIDEAASTVFITDPQTRLDVGAVAKGWSAQRVAEAAPDGLLISVGGNVCATGPKDKNGTPWRVGVQNPDGGDTYLHTLNITDQCVVTSGDYQRCFMVDGKVYHHIIDPDTLYPSTYWRSVTIVCRDSGLADALSTALFLLPYEEGLALAKECGAEAFWVNEAGETFHTPGFEDLIRT
ncbi:MAG: FAD:protein FMN transferase [Oscillospiraceae bacterium]|nr:FAD:protein FMN transferase [Oscillospiraceae bacterium]